MALSATVFPNSLGIRPMFTTKNPTFTKQIARTKKKLMVHSTATPGAPAENFFSGWNSPNAGASVEFVLDDKKILQFMPIGKNGNCLKTWHCGGSGNNSYIATEVCEPIEAQLIPVNFKAQQRNGKYPRTYTTKRIQMELKYRGFYSGNIDGSFGPGTEAAVKTFQKSVGITVDGIVGTGTLAKLKNRKGSYCEYDVVGATPFFNGAYDNAVALFAELCRYVGASPSDIICHQDGYQMGIASNHSDVLHYFPLHGKSMQDFRNDVTAKLNGSYRPLSDGTVTVLDQDFDDACQKVADAGIVSSPDYWKSIDENASVRNDYVMALLRQSGSYFCKKSYKNALTMFQSNGLSTVGLEDGTYSFADVEDFVIYFVKKLTLCRSASTPSYGDAIDAFVANGIINSPDYWRKIGETKEMPNQSFVQALFRQAGDFMCRRGYVYAVDAIRKPIGMNSVDYWKSGNYSYSNCVFLMKAIAKAV